MEKLKQTATGPPPTKVITRKTNVSERALQAVTCVGIERCRYMSF